MRYLLPLLLMACDEGDTPGGTLVIVDDTETDTEDTVAGDTGPEWGNPPVEVEQVGGLWALRPVCHEGDPNTWWVGVANLPTETWGNITWRAYRDGVTFTFDLRPATTPNIFHHGVVFEASEAFPDGVPCGDPCWAWYAEVYEELTGDLIGRTGWANMEWTLTGGTGAAPNPDPAFDCPVPPEIRP